MKSVAWPIVLITLGSLWFLKSTALLPDTPILLTMLLVLAGIGIFLIDGFNKASLVSGSMLVYAGAAIYFLEVRGLRFSHVVSLGMVLFGVLLLLAQSDRIPERSAPRHRHLPRRDHNAPPPPPESL
jgi:hypothetical protein